MKLRDLLSDDAVSGTGEIAVSGLSMDSRHVRRGDLFFALAGAKTDGSKFIDQAIASGAVAVVGEHAPNNTISVPFIKASNARRVLALAAARLYTHQPQTIAAVTGTSGKTSVAAFTRQIWMHEGFEAASIGTIGLVSPKRTIYGSLTTPDPISLHKTLDTIAVEGVTHLAFEASSHGLDQHRLDGVRVDAGAFTNLSRDHMDYHPTVEHYLGAKLRLFTALVKPRGAAVIVADHAHSGAVIDAARRRGLHVMTVGRKGESIRLADATIDGFGQLMTIVYRDRHIRLRLPLVGEFQIENALAAAGLAIGTGTDAQKAFEALEQLEGAKGRIELVGEKNGAAVFVDYAHKPDALEKVLAALRPYAKRKLVVVFGAGGDRDAGKRPVMGEIAAKGADSIIVTDDNPRSENPAAIRAAIMAAAPGAREIGDRAEAIRRAVDELQPGDALVIAGKGHETGQIVGNETLPFSDHDTARVALGSEGRMSAQHLWTVGEVARALRLDGAFPETAIDFVTQDSRLVKPGSLFVALSGTPSGGFVSAFASARNGWDFAAKAETSGAVAMIVPHRIDGVRVPQLVVKDTLLDGLWALGRAARARFAGPVIGLTGSAGKTSTKEFIGAYPGAYASPGSFNNFWGVPLTLCNATPDASAWVVEMGMNQVGEIARLSELAQPTVALVVNVQPVHLEKLGSLEAIRKEKVSIAQGLPRDGMLVLPAGLDAPEWKGRVCRFGEGTEVCEVSHSPRGESWDVTAEVSGRQIDFSVTPGAPHRVHNALAALASVDAAGLDATHLAKVLGSVGIMTGRGVEVIAGGVTVVDDSFNGNPASMAAALDSLKARPVAKGRRIAILGDMLELGDDAPAYHVALAEHLPGIDAVYCVGPLMRHLYDRLPQSQRLGWHQDPATLEPKQIAALLEHGDAVVIKGSKKMFWVNKFAEGLLAALRGTA